MDTAEGCHASGAARQEAGDFARAEALFLQAVALSPREARFHFSLGKLYQDRGRYDMALARYARTAELDPGCAAAHFNAGIAHTAVSRFDSAAAAFQRAIAIDPHEPAAFNNLGIVLQELGRSAEALACFEQAGRMNPSYAEAHCNAGRTLFGQGHWKEAMTRLSLAVTARPHYADAWHNLGLCFHKMRNLDQARSCFETVLSLNPSHHSAHLDMGNVCLGRGDLNGMAVWYRKALDLTVPDASAFNNVGRMFHDLHRHPEAIECFDAALAIDPENAEAHFNRSVTLLALGRWPEGWEEYEWRFRRANWKNGYPHCLPAPRWDGRPFKGKTLLVHCEQGFGDTLQFARYLPWVKLRGGTVVFEVHEPLFSLFHGFPGADELAVLSAKKPVDIPYDYRIPLLSLPGIFGTRVGTIPSTTPYLRADKRKACVWVRRLGVGGLKVGIVWAGSSGHLKDRSRSCSLHHFRTLSDTPSVRLFGIQKWLTPPTSAQEPPDFPFTNLGVDLKNFSDTAALVSTLDLVISVDTAVAHLAGALGKPVWVLLPFAADWRWMEKRADSPWYPTMRLFRQQVQGDWAGVFKHVSNELSLLAGRFGGTL